jgi:serine/threonine-protein kinase
MMSPRPLEATVDFQEPGRPPEQAARIPVVLVAGPGPSPTSEVQALLRKRLRFQGLLGTSGFTLFTVFLGVSLNLGSSQPAAGYGLMITRALCLLAVYAGLTGVLWNRRPLSLGQLRLIEMVAFGLVLGDAASGRYEDIARYGLARILEEGPPVAPPRYAVFYSLPFFALIIAYGTLIPNTWRRASLVVGLMALLPLTLAVAAGISEGMLSVQFVKAFLFPLAMNLAVGVTLAVYGSYRIDVLRQESFTARRLGQYQLIRLLGAGGMGEVYLAEHALLRRPCAIKLIRPERAGVPNNLRRFEREVQATAALTNWHTVEIFDYGHAADGTFYYVMEYLPGLNLEQLVRQQGPLPASRVIHLLRQVCAALREAHAVGLIHRDIKPGNVITGERGGLPDVAKLLDFGLVQTHGIGPDEMKLTQEGVIAGTPAFMSPEQASGKGDLDRRSDIYSLGAVAYFLLTGQPPFIRDTAMRVIAAHLCEPVIPPDHLRPGVPADLQAVILKCLEKDPTRRLQSAESLDEALVHCKCASGGEGHGAASGCT